MATRLIYLEKRRGLRPIDPAFRARVLIGEAGAEQALEIARVFARRHAEWAPVVDAIMDRMQAVEVGCC